MENNNWIYFGVFLHDNVKERNNVAIENQGMDIPYNWKIYNHHMTIAFNNGSEESQKLFDSYKKYLGKNIVLTVDGIGISDDAIAVRVKWDLPIANKIPHITIATPPDGKPVNSNKITKWYNIKPYTITGKIGYYARK